MFIICKSCNKVYVDGKWLIGVPPIGDVKPVLCPECSGSDESHGMVFMEKQRSTQQKKKR